MAKKTAAKSDVAVLKPQTNGDVADGEGEGEEQLVKPGRQWYVITT